MVLVIDKNLLHSKYSFLMNRLCSDILQKQSIQTRPQSFARLDSAIHWINIITVQWITHLV